MSPLHHYLSGAILVLLGLLSWFILGPIATPPPHNPVPIQPVKDIASKDVEEISGTIDLYRKLVQLHSHQDNYRTSYLEGLGIALRSRFEVQGDIADLNEAVEWVRGALGTTPKQVSLGVLLADLLRIRFEKSNHPQDLHTAIDTLCSALAESALQSAESFSILKDLYLCNSLLVRHTEDIRAARSIPSLDSIQLPHIHSPDYPTSSIDFAQAFMYRFYGSGAQGDLDRAIDLYHNALEVHSSGALRGSCLSGLGNAAFVRYQNYGGVEELQTAIECYTEALDYLSKGSPHIQCQIDLAGAYRARFYRDGDDADLQKSFHQLNDALVHCPPGHIHHPSILRSLCWTKLHCIATMTIEDSQDLINSAKEVLSLYPLHHTDRRSCLLLLAGAMYTHFQRVREAKYLDERVALLAESLTLCPDTHPDHGKACNNLADAYLERYEWGDERDVADLNQAIHYDNLAIKTGSAPPWRYRPKAFLFRYLSTNQAEDKNAAKDALLQICQSAHYSYLSRIRMAMQCSSLARSRGTRLADLVILGAQTRIGNLSETGDQFATRITSFSLRVVGVARAVELLEQSRALFWRQPLQLRAPFDGLPKGLQKELQDTAQALEAANDGRVLTEKQVTERKSAALKFETLLQQARQVPGFEDLLLPKTYEQLSAAAAKGPIVILLGDDVAMDTCNVVIIRSPGASPEHLVLRGDSAYRLKQRLEEFSTRQARDSGPTFSEGGDDSHDNLDSDTSRKMVRKAEQPKTEYEALLASLWAQIVRPIIDHLGFTRCKDGQRPRVHWCPTGAYAFLPFHASGLSFTGADSECTMDYMVSSYTPTIEALLRAQEISRRTPKSDNNIKVLAIAQPTTPGHTSLPSTTKEIHGLESVLPGDALIRLQDGHNGDLTLAETNSNVTVSQVVAKLPRASILHLACHGYQDQESPLNSGFALEDGPLAIRKLFEIQIPYVRLAFLSACSTAEGYERLPDEPIHLGTTMLFAGFPNIIATLWTMGDQDGPDVARDVHTQLFECSLGTWRLDGDDIAYALDKAIRNLIHRGIHPSRWATYIHIGL